MDDVLRRLKEALADRYTVEREIGRGGMSLVYLAQDLRNQRKVALKVLRPELTESMGAKRFLREIKISANLEHPHILPLFDSGEADGLLYYTMPFVEGESLRDRLKREGPLPLEDAVQIATEVGEALSCAHEHGVVHRDIKPENVLLTSGIARVADFGIARARTEAGEFNSTTDANIAIGTPEYMSPEQAGGSDTLDGRTDIYSLGCVLYEMLAGEPPFTGRTLQAIIAKHLGEKVPTLTVVRPGIPLKVVKVIEKALAKVAADRYQTASDLASALVLGVSGKTVAAHAVRRWIARSTAVVFAAVALVVWFLWSRPLPLDLNRIVAYPFEVSGAGGEEEARLERDIAYLIVSALDNHGGVKWIEGWDLLEPPYREDIGTATDRELLRAARSNGAGYFLDGQIRLWGDSARVILALHSTEDDSRVARRDTAGLRSDTEHIAYRAVAGVLLSLIPDVGRLGVAAVTGRGHEAIQPFVRAEREFYYGRYRQAFEHYASAVEADSSFALAAVKGAQAASWMHNQSAATELVSVAMDHVETLPPLWAHFARGFDSYLSGRADSAVYHFEQAIALDDEWPEGWMGLGETYQHLLPSRTPQDSLATDAFLNVYQRTEGYAPALYHLAEYAIREGDFLAASNYLEEYRRVEPDTTVLAIPELALACAEESPAVVDWRSYVLADVEHVFQAGRLLGVGGAYPECAIAAWRAVLAHDTTWSKRWAFGTFVGLQSMLSAMECTQDLQLLLDSAAAKGLGRAGKLFYIVDAAVGAPVDADAEFLADSLRDELETLPANRLWFLATWDLFRGRADDARAVHETLMTLADTNRAAARMAAGLSPRVQLAEGDTAAALLRFESLTATAPRQVLSYPWESLGFERLTYARILLERGEYEEAFRVASVFDSPGAASLIFSAFLPASLQLRFWAAQGMGNQQLSKRMRERLTRLGRGDLVDTRPR